MRIFEKSKKYYWEAPEKKTYLSLFNKTKTLRDDVYDVDGDNGDDVMREEDFEEEDGNGEKKSIEEKIVCFFVLEENSRARRGHGHRHRETQIINDEQR